MTPTPPSTNSSSAGGHSPEAQYRVVRKRNRVPLSCGPCRNRKLKCNRSHPCENCIRRGDASACSYAAPGTRKRNQSQGSVTPDDMQNRIDRLEGLVLSLMTNGAQSAGPTAAAAAISRSQSDSAGSSTYPTEPEREDEDVIKEEDEDNDSEVDGVTNSFGMIKVDQDKGKLMYFGESHWNMVLRDITEVKNYFSSHKKEMETNCERIKNSKPSTARDGPAFLFSPHAEASDSDLRAELPSKSAVDKLVTRYFSSYDPSVYVLHSPTFHTQLQRHWQDPSKTSIVWLGLLYSILCLSMQSYHKIGDEPLEWKGRTLELAAEYRLRTVQCLVNSDYIVSSMYTIETMILYVHGEYNVGGPDAEVGVWVIVGIIVRLSMRMGYHRDPSKYPELTPFQGEMRRRCWSFVRQMDTMFSFQLSLPSMIRSTDCDAQLPRNIFDDEFSPESKILPQPRPITEPTPISYLISKASIAYEFGEIIEEINSVSGTHIGYEDVLKRDNRLRELKEKIAPHLRLRPPEECTLDPAPLLMQRFNLDTFWQKTICVLHRKYFGRALQSSRYSHSRRACVDASMEILRHQSQLHRESQPGGRMRPMKWFISSVTKHDYLLGAMIVSLDLHYDSSSRSLPVPPPNFDPCFWSPAQRAEMLQALKASQAIWKESAETSMEAYKANKVLGIILEKLKLTTEKSEKPTASEVSAQMDEASLPPEHSAAMTLGMLSGGLTPNSAAMFNYMPQSPGGARYAGMDTNMGDFSNSTGLTPNYGMDSSNPFSNMNGVASPFSVFGNPGSGIEMDMPGNLDWDAWDSYIQNANPVDPSFQFYPPNLDQSLNADTQQVQNDPYTFGNSDFMGSNNLAR